MLQILLPSREAPEVVVVKGVILRVTGRRVRDARMRELVVEVEGRHGGEVHVEHELREGADLVERLQASKLRIDPILHVGGHGPGLG